MIHWPLKFHMQGAHGVRGAMHWICSHVIVIVSQRCSFPNSALCQLLLVSVQWMKFTVSFACQVSRCTCNSKGLVAGKMHWSVLLKLSVTIETTLSCHSRRCRHGNGTYDSGPMVTSLQCHRSQECVELLSSLHWNVEILYEQPVVWMCNSWMQANVRSGKDNFYGHRLTHHVSGPSW